MMGTRVLMSFLALALWFSSPAAVFAAEPARIVSLSGDVKARSSATDSPRAARNGEKLETGAWISTGADSSCEIAIGNGGKSAVKIRSQASARITSLSPVRVDLENGKILALVRGLKEGSTFEVGTPAAVASVRGTIFTASPERFEAIEDNIQVDPIGEGDIILLEAGQAAEFETGGTFSVSDIPRETVAETKREAEIVGTHVEAAPAPESVSARDGAGKSGSSSVNVTDGGQGSFDALSGSAGAPDVPKDALDNINEARRQSAEIESQKKLLEDTLGRGADRNNANTAHGGTTG